MSGLDAALLLGGLAVVTLPVWLPRGAVRVVGALWFALAAVVALRLAGFLGDSLTGVGGAFAALAVAGWATRAVPLLRRVAFLVPSLVLLVYVTTWLMYEAPGNPFANERAASPQVEAALRAL